MATTTRKTRGAAKKLPAKKAAPAKKATPPKARAVSLHIGINKVSSAAYAGWTGPLAACEFDANDMAAIAKGLGAKSTVLLTAQATRAAVLRAIRSAAKALGPGDLFFMSYSGHGGQVTDVTGEEEDKKDETWCLYDGQLIDDELYAELASFKRGVRVLVLSDSCHSGTVTRAAPVPGETPTERPKWMPTDVAEATYEANKAFYDKLQRSLAKAAGGKAVDPDAALANVVVSGRTTAIVKKFEPSVILISGCQDNQTSMDGNHNGAFTEQLLAVWAKGAFKGNHAQLHKAILARMPPSQSPNLFTLGPAAKFLAQAPFRL